MARQQGLSTAKALAGEVSLTTKLYGRLALSPDKVSHVRARFPGSITRVNVNFGDEVKKGQLLASVESNNSLQSYNLLAPISGTITAKEASTGEVAAEQVLFTITNTSSLWAELKVFPEQASAVKAGQKVHMMNGEREFVSTIKQLLPSEQAKPYRIARVPIENTEAALFPGLLVEAQVIIQQETVDIRIPNSAIQRYEGSQVAFLKTDGKYQVKPLQLGISDGRFSEVISGLRQGDEIVVENSYLIKADLEKEGAAHAH
jgi:cobalt-zinc-cadmium efflux system membrane fusion protein